VAVLYSNNATTTLSASLTSSATSLTVAAGGGALFPSITGSDYFYVTLSDALNNLEIVKVTARAVDTLTIVRAQEGTTARAYAAGDSISLRVTAAGLANKLDKDTGGTLQGKLVTATPTTASAGFNLPAGTAPTSPVDGDTWSTSAGMFVRVGGVTHQVAFADGGNVADSVAHAVTFAATGGATPGTTFDGSVARTVDYSTVGAAAKNPAGQTITTAASITPTFSDDFVAVTAQAGALTINNPTGTAVDMYGLVIRIKDNGSTRTLTWGSQYRGVGVTLPTSTTANKVVYLGMIYNAAETKWDVVSVAQL
jgi:hypothetical protein